MSGSLRHQVLTLASLPATAAVLLLAGCSSSGDTATAPPPMTFAPNVGVTPGIAGASTMPPMPGMPMPAPGAAPADAPAPVPAGPNAVDINDFAFAPSTLTVRVGTTVTWTNEDGEPHTVVSNDGSTFHSPGMDTNGSFSFTFTDAGSFDYVCSIHPFMHGTVVVEK